MTVVPVRGKDQAELRYWQGASPSMHLAKYPMYLSEWGYEDVNSVLEIGIGPYSGFLPGIVAPRKVGLDPLIESYRAHGVFRECAGVEYVCKYLEEFETPERFDAVLCADVIDHNDLGFHVVPQLASFLNPGGRLYLHVHLRPSDRLNFIHDHSLKEADLDAALAQTDLVEEKRTILPKDIDGKFCAALVGVWRLASQR